MTAQEAIAWCKITFAAEIETATIPYQATGSIGSVLLQNKSSVSDTIDADSSAPRSASATQGRPDGEQRYAIARQALIDRAQSIHFLHS